MSFSTDLLLLSTSLGAARTVGPRVHATSPRGLGWLFLLAWVLGTGGLQGATEWTKGGWEEIPEAELAATEPRLDANAHIEFLYRNLYINDTGDHTTSFRHHNRLKVFTEAGVEELDKIDIPYESGWRVRNLKARIIYPDRTITRLEKEDFYRRELLEDGEFKGYAMSFSFPGLRPGCIVEYEWTASRQYWLPSLVLPLHAQWPTWAYDLKIRPFSQMASRFVAFNCQYRVEKKGGQYLLSLQDLPAESSEPYLPPRKDFEPWIHLAYSTELDHLDPEDYWGYRGGFLVEVNKDMVRERQGAVKKLTQTLFAGTSDPEEKLRRAYKYCMEEVINLSAYTDAFTEEEIEELKDNDTPSDTLKHGYGTQGDINALFTSLARVAGFEAYMGQVEDRSDSTFRRTRVGNFALPDWLVAVKDGKDWRFFDPGSSYLPFGRLNPENTDAKVIVADRKYYYWSATPGEELNWTTSKRIGRFVVNEDGNLEGLIKVVYSGYEALWRRRLFSEMSRQEIEDYVQDEEWVPRSPRALVADLEVTGAKDRDADLVLLYSLEIPGYGEFAGSRLLLNPAVFEQGRTPPFPDETREEGVYISYSSRQYDDVSIQLPDGYEMETEGFSSVGLAGRVINRNADLRFDEETGILRFLRLRVIDRTPVNGRRHVNAETLLVNPPAYAELKAEFDALNRLDSQPLSLVKK